MATPDDTLSDAPSRLDEIILDYLNAVDAGRPPDREAVMRANPELATELNAFFGDRDRFEKLAPANPAKRSLSPKGASTSVRYFGDYELIDEVARGGMGVVYKARQVNLKRTVALKMILVGQLANAKDVARFYAEAQAAAKLQHPNIVPIYEVGEHEGQHYFTMAFIDGESLAHRVAREVLPPRAAAAIMLKVARAIAFAHVEGVVHRDLKPANILMDRNGEPHITDFGLAKRIDDEKGTKETIAQLTVTGQVLGTPSYMPPEQASGRTQDVGPLADVYSLGAVLYCLITGRPPFQAASPLDTLMQVIRKDAVSPRALNPDVPRDLETICLKCLEKEPGKRIASAKELGDELERFLNGEPIHARPVGRLERGWRWCRRNPALASASALACLALVAATAVSLMFAVSVSNTARHDRQLLAESYLDRGQVYCEQGDIARGMLWFGHSLETAPAEATDLPRAIRANLGAWRRDAARLKAVLGPKYDVGVVAFGPDGKTIFIGSANDSGLWDLRTGEPIGKHVDLKGHDLFKVVAISPDGKTMVGRGTEYGTVAQGWDLSTGKLLWSLQLNPQYNENGIRQFTSESLNESHHIAFSADGKVLATADYKRIQLWEPDTSKPHGALIATDQTDWIESLALSFDGKLVAAGNRDGSARIWDAATGKPFGARIQQDGWIRAMAFSPDSKLLLTGSSSGNVQLWDVATSKPNGKAMVHTGQVMSVAFSADGKRILSGATTFSSAEACDARLWDVATQKLICLPIYQMGGVGAVAFAPDGKTALTGSVRNSYDQFGTRVWELPAGPAAERTLTHDSPVRAIAYSPDGRVIAVGTSSRSQAYEGKVWLWDAETGKARGAPLVHEAPVEGLAFSPDGKLLAAAVDIQFKHKGPNGYTPRTSDVCVWSLETYKMVCPPLVHDGEIPLIVFDPKYQLTTTDSRGVIRDWDLASGKPIGATRMDEEGSSYRYTSRSPDGKYLMHGNGEDHTGVLTNATPTGVDSHKSVAWLQAPGGIYGASAFSPDSKLLVTTGGFVRLWDVATQKQVGSTLGNDHVVAFSPDGKTILTGGADGVVRFWPVPPVVEGDVDRIVTWTKVLTGTELVGNVSRVMGPNAWKNMQNQLEKMGGPPVAR